MAGGPVKQLIDRSVREKIVLVGVVVAPHTLEEAEEGLDELSLLVDTAGADAMARVLQKRDAPDPVTYVGKGKAEELREISLTVDARHGGVRHRARSEAKSQPRKAARSNSDRPNRGHPRHLRPERPLGRRQGPGRVGPSFAIACPASAARAPPCRSRALASARGDRAKRSSRSTAVGCSIACTSWRANSKICSGVRLNQRQGAAPQSPSGRHAGLATRTLASRPC